MDSTRSLNLDQLDLSAFQPYGTQKPKGVKHSQKFHHYQYLALKNASSEKRPFCFFSRTFKYNDIYELKNNKYEKIGEFGLGIPFGKWETHYTMEEIVFEAEEAKSIVIHSYENASPYAFYPNLYLTNRAYVAQKTESTFKKERVLNLTTAAFVGILLFLGLLMFVQYIQHRTLTYLFYGCYLFVLFLYFNDLFERPALINYFYSYIPWVFLKYKFTSYFVFVFYLLFTSSFLDLKKTMPWLYTFFQWLIKGIILVFVIDVVLAAFDIFPEWRYQMYYVFRYSLDVLNVFVVGSILFKHPDRLKYFYVLGSACLIIGAVLSLYISVKEYADPSYFQGYPILFTMIGILLEAMFFSAGVGYKTKMIKDEKEEAQRKYINELQKNSQLQIKINEGLEDEIRLRSKEISEVKEQKMKADFDKRVKELEGEMLLAQMNPHFIFNSLNAIKYYAISKAPEETAQYITDFSQLMRLILQNSRKKWISLNEEIEFLKLYINIESKRFNKSFQTEFEISNDIDLEKEKIMPMIIQPIIENAIVHGLLPLESRGKLLVKFELQNNYLITTIEDNGIGRAKASQTKSKNKAHPGSLGTKITEERMNIFDQLHNVKLELNIIDLYNESGDSAGTKVIIKLPQTSQ